MSRWQAGGIHFGISVVVFLLLLAIILLVWYPGILFSVDGGWIGLRIVMGVDLVLGPLLTLIVFKAGKPSLKFDLTCIATFQAVCLAGGMWVVYQERPVALVLAHDTIYSLASQEFEEFEQDSALLRDFPGRFPKLVYAELPENDIEADIVALRSQFIGVPLYMQTERFRAIPEQAAAIEPLFRKEADVRATMSEELQSRVAEGCLVSKFVSAVVSGYVCFDPERRRLREYYPFELLREAVGGEEGNAGGDESLVAN